MIRCRECGTLAVGATRIPTGEPEASATGEHGEPRASATGEHGEPGASATGVIAVPTDEDDRQSLPSPLETKPSLPASQSQTPISERTAVSSAEPSPAKQTTPQALPRRNPQRPTAAAVVLLIAACTLVSAGYFLVRPEARPAGFRRALISPVGRLTTVAYSPNGRTLVAGCASGDVIVWRLAAADGMGKRLPGLSTEAILALATSADSFVLAGGMEKSLMGWPVAGPPADASGKKFTQAPAPITALAVRMTPPEFAVGLANGALYVFGKSKKSSVKSEHQGGVKTAAYHPRGPLLVTGGTDGRLVWRNADTRSVVAKTEAHASEVAGLAFSPDGRWLATGAWNGDIHIWDAETRSRSATGTQADAVSALAWCGDLLVTGSWDGRLRFWSAERAEPIHEVNTGAPIHSLAASPDGDTVATVSHRAEVVLWNVPAP